MRQIVCIELSDRQRRLTYERMLDVARQEALKDVEIQFSSHNHSILKFNRFLLSLLSRPLCRMICGQFEEAKTVCINFADIKSEAFSKVVDIACGEERFEINGLSELLDMAKIVDKYEILGLQQSLEEIIIQHLNIENCCEILAASPFYGIPGVANACQDMILENFDAVVVTPGYPSLSEDDLSTLLACDDLNSHGEESVLAAVLQWMGTNRNCNRSRLLSHIRLPLMDYESLQAVCKTFSSSLALEDMLSEAEIILKRKGGEGENANLGELTYFCNAPTKKRISSFEPNFWAKLASCVETKNRQCLEGHVGPVRALACCNEMMYSSSSDGTIRVWSRRQDTNASRADGDSHEENVMERIRGTPAGSKAGTKFHSNKLWKCDRVIDVHSGPVWALAAWGECLLACGTADGIIPVWDIWTGTCLHRLQGHAGPINALLLLAAQDEQLPNCATFSGTASVESARNLEELSSKTKGWLVSASDDRTVRAWSLSAASTNLASNVTAVPLLNREISHNVISAEECNIDSKPDSKPEGFDSDPDFAERYKCERVFTGCTGGVYSLACWSGRVLAGATDGTVRAWHASTGNLEAVMQGHSGCVAALAVVRRRRLISAADDGQVREWELGTWRCLRTLSTTNLDFCSVVNSSAPCTAGDSEAEYVLCLAVFGRHLVVGSVGKIGPSNMRIRVWDVYDGTLLREFAAPPCWAEDPSDTRIRVIVPMDGSVVTAVGNDVFVFE